MAVKEAVLMAPPMTASKLLINPDQEQRGLTAGVWSISPQGTLTHRGLITARYYYRR